VADRPRSETYEALGAYVRSQRQLASLSLRQAAELARISNPYLSQIEHGLALPSITVLSALAEALQVSADALLLRAAGMSPGDDPDQAVATEYAIRHDPRLDDAQKHALLAVLTSYVGPSPPRSKPTAERVNGAVPAVTRAPHRRRPPKAPPKNRESRDHA
jgi:transcriptional regulator with XRE-family HTH domain